MVLFGLASILASLPEGEDVFKEIHTFRRTILSLALSIWAILAFAELWVVEQKSNPPPRVHFLH